MIKVSGQYELTASVQGNEILDVTHFINFSLFQYSGTELPVMEMEFQTPSDDIVKRLNESRVLLIAFGYGATKVKGNFYVVKPKINRLTRDLWNVDLIGVLNVMSQWEAATVSVGAQQSGIEEIISRLTFYKVDTNIQQSQDIQNWMQYGQPLKQYIEEVWYHSDVGDDDYLIMAPTIDTFRIRSMKTLIKDQPKWVFNNNQVGDNVLGFEPNYSYNNRVTEMNSLGARGVSCPVFDMGSGQFSVAEGKPQVFLANTDKLGQNPDFIPLFMKQQSLSRNQHANFWKAYAKHRCQLMLTSSATVDLVYRNKFIDIRPLDLVYFKDEDVVVRKDIAAESSTGLYIVSRVSHQVDARHIATRVELTREAFHTSVET